MCNRVTLAHSKLKTIARERPCPNLYILDANCIPWSTAIASAIVAVVTSRETSINIHLYLV
ncbi:hypothetical protein E1A91_D05G308400v1 [Gossypium mustelinum]|uniref:Uncharacterized protein n=1 Tax=Gossypium mustelinum TaxID=34275 RepID=A0A5D2V321_GOSMU|nr:hypothetical protein E1A91_D05G308400v1 [Gossypium mustelinum]